MERQPSRTWEVGAFNRETNDWNVTTLHSYDHNENNSLLKPVEPRSIELDTRKPRRKKYNEILVFGDAQIGYRNHGTHLEPIHDEQAMKRVSDLAEDLRPDYVVDLGDSTDLAELSRFSPDSTHFQGTIQPSMQRTHEFLADITERTPGAERHMLDGNHTKRLGAYALKNAGPLNELMHGDFPALSYPGLLRLDEIGWKFHGGYGASEYEYKDDLVFIHGTVASTAGTAVKVGKDIHNVDRNVVQGHAHRIETAYHTDRRGRQLGAFVVGALCRIDGAVPSHGNGVDQYGEVVKKYENWQNGVMVVKDYGDGRYQFDQVPIHKDGLFYNGKRY